MANDYVFNDSRALKEGRFIGLPLDEDYESDKTEGRIEQWLEKIRPEMSIELEEKRKPVIV